jgi:phosphomevalonate kinase
MKVIAPGKLVLTGAYAVLEGAPAIVAAVDRHASADVSRVAGSPTAEVRVAFGGEQAPELDLRPLHDESGRKLGLGSSAAAVVASLGARAHARGDDPRDPTVRARIFQVAREAHARVQGGGSGVDVAASVHGGVLRYWLGESGSIARSVELPPGLVITAYFSGKSARTSELRARVTALRAANTDAYAKIADSMRGAACLAADAFEAREARWFVSAARDYAALLADLGRAADAPIVPPSIAELASLAAREHAAFLPSGAGGGDVAVWIGLAPASTTFADRARALSMDRLALSVDPDGVRAQDHRPVERPAGLSQLLNVVSSHEHVPPTAQ